MEYRQHNKNVSLSQYFLAALYIDPPSLLFLDAVMG